MGEERTDGDGVDFMISALGPGAPASTMVDALQAVRRGGRAVNVGAVAETLPLDMHWLMDEQIQLIGSNWFTAAQGQEMAELARAGLLDMSVFEHHRFPLEEVNHAISGLPTETADSATTSSCPDPLQRVGWAKSPARGGPASGPGTTISPASALSRQLPETCGSRRDYADPHLVKAFL